jgi:hypothetical protein
VDVKEHLGQENVRLCLTTHFIMFGLQVNVNFHRLAVSHKLLTIARMSSLWFDRLRNVITRVRRYTRYRLKFYVVFLGAIHLFQSELLMFVFGLS